MDVSSNRGFIGAAAGYLMDAVSKHFVVEMSRAPFETCRTFQEDGSTEAYPVNFLS